MPSAKKPAAKKRPRKPTKNVAAARRESREKGIEVPTEAPKKAPGRRRLNPAQQAQRDSLMVARLAQNWTWQAIAAEAGMSVPGAKKAVKSRRESGGPLRFDADPVKIVEDVFTAYQLSVGDFEAIAYEALNRNQLAVAVGAKKGANDAREKVLTLLQITGRLPHELGSLRHLIDLRAIAVRMLDAMDGFERRLAEVELDAAQAQAVRDGVLEVRSTFNELLGIEEEDETPELPVVTGSASAA